MPLGCGFEVGQVAGLTIAEAMLHLIVPGAQHPPAATLDIQSSDAQNMAPAALQPATLSPSQPTKADSYSSPARSSDFGGWGSTWGGGGGGGESTSRELERQKLLLYGAAFLESSQHSTAWSGLTPAR